MTRLNAFMSMLLGGLALFVGLQPGGVQASTTQPCISVAINASNFNFIPVNGGGQTYCQSAFGWSDTWFPTTQPSTYNQHLDALSGDNSPSLFWFTGAAVPVGHGTGNIYNMLSPFGDVGTLNSVVLPALPPSTQTNTTVITDIHSTGANSAQSVIGLGGLMITIDTLVGANGITETFTFQNQSAGSITDLFFDDYFNFHANGSLNVTDIACPTTSYAGGVVTTVGLNSPTCSPIVQNGSMFGSLAQGGPVVIPTFFDVGSTAQVLAAMVAANTGNFSGFTNNGPFQGDGAADFVWNLGALAQGTSTSFTINKEFLRISIPEPATLLLFGAGFAGMGLIRRRRG